MEGLKYNIYQLGSHVSPGAAAEQQLNCAQTTKQRSTSCGRLSEHLNKSWKALVQAEQQQLLTSTDGSQGHDTSLQRQV